MDNGKHLAEAERCSKEGNRGNQLEEVAIRVKYITTQDLTCIFSSEPSVFWRKVVDMTLK